MESSNPTICCDIQNSIFYGNPRYSTESWLPPDLSLIDNNPEVINQNIAVDHNNYNTISISTIFDSNYLEHLEKNTKQYGPIPIIDDYRIRSTLNNLPRSISCINGLSRYYRFLKFLFGFPQMITLFNLFDYFFIGLSILLTYILVKFDIYYQTDTGTLITFVIFPLTYAMGNSYSRRKDMLLTVSNTRSSIISMIMSICQLNLNKTNIDSHNLSQLTLSKLREHLVDCRYYATSQNENDRVHFLNQIYCRFNHLNWILKFLLEGENDVMNERISNLFLSLISKFEEFRLGVDYQETSSLHYFLRTLIVINTGFLLPWFSGIIIKSDNSHILGYFLVAGIISSMLGLYRIHKRLENPIGNDWDDINIKSIMGSRSYYDSFKLWNESGRPDLNAITKFMGRSDYDLSFVFNPEYQ